MIMAVGTGRSAQIAKNFKKIEIVVIFNCNKDATHITIGLFGN
jgi:hypothetical protein